MPTCPQMCLSTRPKHATPDLRPLPYKPPGSTWVVRVAATLRDPWLSQHWNNNTHSGNRNSTSYSATSPRRWSSTPRPVQKRVYCNPTSPASPPSRTEPCATLPRPSHPHPEPLHTRRVSFAVPLSSRPVKPASSSAKPHVHSLTELDPRLVVLVQGAGSRRETTPTVRFRWRRVRRACGGSCSCRRGTGRPITCNASSAVPVPLRGVSV